MVEERVWATAEDRDMVPAMARETGTARKTPLISGRCGVVAGIRREPRPSAPCGKFANVLVRP